MRTYIFVAIAAILLSDYLNSSGFWREPRVIYTLEDLRGAETQKEKIGIIHKLTEQNERHTTSYDSILYGTLGDIYADPQSKFYDPAEAKRAYFKSFRNDFNYIFYRQESCINNFHIISEMETRNDIHASVASHMLTFCSLPKEKLFAIAEDFESKGEQFFIDPFIALMLYKYINTNKTNFLLTPEGRNWQRLINEKIETLQPGQLYQD